MKEGKAEEHSDYEKIFMCFLGDDDNMIYKNYMAKVTEPPVRYGRHHNKSMEHYSRRLQRNMD